MTWFPSTGSTREQSRFYEPGEIHIAYVETLNERAKGSFVLLEMNLQQESLQALVSLTLNDQEIDEFREKYGKLNEPWSAR